MYVKFWGTRGSIPTPLSSTSIQDKIRQALLGAQGVDLRDHAAVDRYIERLPHTVRGTVGGNTACIEIRVDNQLLILDAGSGLRVLGLELMRQGAGKGNQHMDMLITHTHWDHIQGYPFFVPAFIPGNSITFYSPFANLQERLSRQQDDTYFPVTLEYMRATRCFHTLAPGQWTRIGNVRIYPLRLSHPGTCYGYRIEDDHSSLVYATDAEYKRVDPAHTEEYIRFFHEADLLVFDAQYTITEAQDRPDWGHSFALVGAEFARRANVRRLALFHHDPTSSDEKIWIGRDQAEAYITSMPNVECNCEVIVAYDGLSITL
jgi:phosphoribosyl 1,2-cyclic phosphodiesterase